jgi:hypothetical protein
MARRCQPAEGIRPGLRHLFFVANILSQSPDLDFEQLSVELHAEVLASVEARAAGIRTFVETHLSVQREGMRSAPMHTVKVGGRWHVADKPQEGVSTRRLTEAQAIRAST